APPEFPNRIPCTDPGGCVTCHKDNESMDPSHAFSCSACHGGNPAVQDKPGAHEGLIPDPGDLDVVQKTCGRCHPEEARRVRRSSMALAPRMINHTRFAFGAQASPSAAYLTRSMDSVEQIPRWEESKNIGDDLLRRSCLRCHLFTNGSERPGELRGRGCSACHVPYPNDAKTKTGFHAIVRDPGVTPCLKCHNSNHVGADFVGLFEKDYHRGFRSPFVRGRLAETIYGSEQHMLSSDIHFRSGLKCSDCHTLDEIHGTGEVNKGPTTGVTISCRGCHVTGDHPAVMKDPNGSFRLLRGDRLIPSWNPESIPHSVASHKNRLRCSSCHAAWSFQDYGFHLMLEERPDYWKWAPTAAQNDPQVQEILMRSVGTFVEMLPPSDGPKAPTPEEKWQAPLAKDWLNGEKRPGAWFRGYSYRRWSNPPLGIDGKGVISIMRPMFQYVVSHVDSNENLLLDRWIPRTGGGNPALLWNPYSPHTITNRPRMCHDCHGSSKAAGLGEGLLDTKKRLFVPVVQPEKKLSDIPIRWDAMLDLSGDVLQSSVIPGAGPLDYATMRGLLEPSPLHRSTWNKYLREIGNPRP
ncbi:MAG: hypothetical protein QG577_376, partial [Thermodesulfobacteriota bacterium]|nr:hypothetical protein [Thermodesulfobacteriota bacterium]